MSIRNRFVSQLTGVKFQGISTDTAAEILMQWKHADKKLNGPASETTGEKLPEHEFLEIPKQIIYLDNWGKFNQNYSW